MSARVRSHLRRPVLLLPAIRTLIQDILHAAGTSRSEVSVDLVGDARMRRLNRQYRGIDRSTDVLAFAMRDVAGPRSALLGDVVIAVPTACRQAQRLGRTLDEELTTLLIHGIVHLLGYDHERSRREAARMARKERIILGRIVRRHRRRPLSRRPSAKN
jgi:probable rRNA maturation factor